MNFKHLHNFGQIAKSGIVAQASEQRPLTLQNISVQMGLLGKSAGVPQIVQRSRNLDLTDAGRPAFGDAQNIFAPGSGL
jgi:DNA-binding transcriptional LysR family regulator